MRSKQGSEEIKYCEFEDGKKLPDPKLNSSRGSFFPSFNLAIFDLAMTIFRSHFVYWILFAYHVYHPFSMKNIFATLRKAMTR